jgi:GNAT superfamily N-acetyltransferase
VQQEDSSSLSVSAPPETRCHLFVQQSPTATLDGKVVGLAMSGPALDEDATWESQLYVLYTYASVHGRGAGSDFLNAVIDPGVAAGLWVVDPSPRAQAFYRKHGFEPDGRHRVDDGVRVIRMTRPPRWESAVPRPPAVGTRE